MNIAALAKRVEKLQERAVGPGNRPTFKCYWGDEEIPDDGTPLIVTEWGNTIVEDEEDASEE